MRFLASFLAGAATAITLVLAAPGSARAATDQPPFLDVVQAFPGQARVDDAGRGPLLVQFDVPPGYHLYRERFAIEAEGTALPAPRLPEGKAEFDPNFNKTMTLWAGAVRIAQPLPAGALPASLTVRFQGCADRGLCYPPQQALVHLTRHQAQELGPGIRVNAVAPGVVRTRLAEELWKEHEEAVAANTPLRRIGEPEDIGSAVAFLAGTAASWITGETLVIDGGQRWGSGR